MPCSRRNIEVQMTKKTTMIQCGVPRILLVLSRKAGRQRSPARRRAKPVTPTKEVMMEPESTRKASTDTHVSNQAPAARRPSRANTVSLLACTSANGNAESVRKDSVGLNRSTATHMLRSVLTNTPGFCSSTKLADVSKPVMPRAEAA